MFTVTLFNQIGRSYFPSSNVCYCPITLFQKKEGRGGVLLMSIEKMRCVPWNNTFPTPDKAGMIFVDGELRFLHLKNPLILTFLRVPLIIF